MNVRTNKLSMYEVVKLIVHDVTVDIMLYEITLKSQRHLNNNTLHVTCLIVLGVQKILYFISEERVMR